jgi:hypothetical protein
MALAVLVVLAVAGAIGFAHLSSGSVVAGRPARAASFPSTSASSAPSSSATAKKAATLDSINVHAADLPGWDSTADDSSDDGSDGSDDGESMATCVGRRDTDDDIIAEADSDDFDHGSVDVYSSVDRYKTQSDIDTDAAIARSSKFIGCLRPLLKHEVQASLPTGVTLKSLSLVRTSRVTGQPSNLVAVLDTVARIEANGHVQTEYESDALISGPKIEVDLTITDTGKPASASLQKRLIATLAARATRA